MNDGSRVVLAPGDAAVSGIRVAGDGAHGSLVAIHGAGHSADAFATLFDEPALARFERIAIDLPGRFGSTGPACASTEAAAIAVGRVLSALALPRPIRLVGHSFGGAVAIEVALRGVASIDALVLLSTGARLRVLPANLERFAKVAAGEATRMRGLGFSEGFDAAAIERFESRVDAVPPTSALADWQAADRFDRMADVGRIRVRTLVVGGDADPFTPHKYAAFMAERMADAELVTVSGGSHLAIVERAREVAEAIAAFG